jgi:glycosyltransferase involved in cell wall biosynthesis
VRLRVALDARHAGRGLGIATMIQSLGSRLAWHPEVELVWCGAPELAPPGTAAIIDVAHWPYPFLDSLAGKTLVARSGADVMHFTGNTGWTGGWQPMPSVLTIHDLIFLATGVSGRTPRQVVGHRYARRNVRRAARNAAAIATPSVHTRHEIARLLPGTQEPEVIYNGVEIPTDATPRELEDGHVVAFSGRDPRKAVDLALAGWRAARPGVPWRIHVFAGAGLPDHFRTETADERAAGDVVIHEYVPREELLDILGRARALIYPSQDEGFGLPVLEAMALGVPVITGLAEVTREIAGSACLTIDPGAPTTSIAQALERLAVEPGLADRLASDGKARAASFTWDRATNAYLQLYRRAAGRP